VADIFDVLEALAEFFAEERSPYRRGKRRCTRCRRWWDAVELVNGRKCPVCGLDTRAAPREKNGSVHRLAEVTLL